MTVAVVTPVYGNEATLAELAARLGAALAGREWRLRFVIDASPDGSRGVACRLADADPRIAVTDLPVNAGQNRALIRGLADEPAASTLGAENGAQAWVCLDADLQDPPEAVPALLERLAAGDVDAVFAGRRGAYESPARLLTGRLHRAVVSRLAGGLPPDAGAFVALGRDARDALVALNPPSLVAGVGAAQVRAVSIPVERAPRPSGRSAWTATARARQSAQTLVWLASHRVQR